MLALAWSSLRPHQHVRPDTPNPTRPGSQVTRFFGGGGVSCGYVAFRFLFL